MPKRKIIMKIDIAKSLLDKYFAIEIYNNFIYIFLAYDVCSPKILFSLIDIKIYA